MGTAQSKTDAATSTGAFAGAGGTLYVVGLSITGGAAAVAVGAAAATAVRYVAQRLLGCHGPLVTSEMVHLLCVTLPASCVAAVGGSVLLGPSAAGWVGLAAAVVFRGGAQRSERLFWGGAALSALCILPPFVIGGAALIGCILASDSDILHPDTRKMCVRAYQLSGVSLVGLALSGSPLIACVANLLWAVSFITEPGEEHPWRKLAISVVVGSALPYSSISMFGPFLGIVGVGCGWVYEWLAGFPNVHDEEEIGWSHFWMAGIVAALPMRHIGWTGLALSPFVHVFSGAVSMLFDIPPRILAQSFVIAKREKNARDFEDGMQETYSELRRSGNYVEFQDNMNELMRT